jgi:serine protease Do
MASAYTPQFDALERENINVYEQASRAVVTLNAIVDGGPSSGAGVIIDPAGIILTSSHVIGESHQVSVSLEDGKKLRGTVIGRVGEKTDLALIKVSSPAPLPTVPLGDSSQLRVGQRVLAIGNPYGFERTLTTGIISRIDKARNRLQTDAAINPGNSGGPLLDNQGYLIGINQSIYNPEGNRSNIGIGFAVPINAARDFVKKLAARPAIPVATTPPAYPANRSASRWANPYTMPQAVAPPIVHHNPTSNVGYENVSDILQRFTRDAGW